MRNELDNAYGKVDQKVYEQMKDAIWNVTTPQDTMRVDYEIGVDESGEFSCWFGVSCEDCGYEFDFKHKEQTKVESK